MIKQGNCLELLKDVPDGSIDAIICDLPYGVTQAPFDKKLPLEEMWIQFRRVIKKNAAVVLFSQQPFSAELVMSNKRNFKYVWTWHKKQCTGSSMQNISRSEVARILPFSIAGNALTILK